MHILFSMTNPREKPDLQSLYPTAKTYDEKIQEREEIHALRESWKPKHPKLQALGIAMLLASLTYAWVIIVPPFMLSMPFAGVFIGVLLGLLLIFGFIAGAKRIIALLSQ